MVVLIYSMLLRELCIINVCNVTLCLTLGFGDDAEDEQVSVPTLPPHLEEWNRRKSKVDIEVPYPCLLYLTSRIS
jgi:hypothetical protein